VYVIIISCCANRFYVLEKWSKYCTIDKIIDISLGHDTIRSKIITIYRQSIGSFYRKKTKIVLITCTYFSLSLDESAHVQHIN